MGTNDSTLYHHAFRVRVICEVREALNTSARGGSIVRFPGDPPSPVR